MSCLFTGVYNNINPLVGDIISNILNKAVLVFSPEFLKAAKNNTYIYCLTVSGVQTWFSWVLCFRVSHKAVIKVLAGAGVSSETQLGKGLLLRSHSCCQDSVPCDLLDSGPQFLAACCPEEHLISLSHKPP